MTELIELGRFKRAKDGGWDGEINTLTIVRRKVRLVPNDNRMAESAPAFRVMLGWSRIGAAWAARSRGDPPRDYLRVRLDDPVFAGALTAALFYDEDGATGRLLWNGAREPGHVPDRDPPPPAGGACRVQQ